MPRRALRSYPTKDATDLTDAQWAAIAPLVATPSPNAAVRPTAIAARSSTRCAPTIAPPANGACVRTMVRRCVRFAPLSPHGIVMEP